jgi:hypothetical protein
MRPLSKSKRRVAGLFGAGALLIGGVGAPVLFAAGPASAGTCAPACTITGTATLGTGTLTMTAPDSLAWAGTITGAAQEIVDAVPADQGYTVNDASGSNDGWTVSVAATQFTSTTPAATLPNADTFSTNGSLSDETANTAPSDACTSGAGTCTLPDDTGITYPVAITTTLSTAAAAPSIVYQAAAGTGLGSVDIGGSAATDPVGWWLAVRGDATAATYTSSVTITVASIPPPV